MNTNKVDEYCPSCNTLVTGNYCANCGEKKVNEHYFAMKHVIEESIEGFTHLDNKFFRSVKLLVTRPGLLAQYFSIGKRTPYMKPLQLFIVCNLLFFFLSGTANMFFLSLYSYNNYAPFTNFNTREIIKSKAHNETEYNALSLMFNEKMHTQSKAFIIFFIPLFAFACAGFFYRSKKFLSEHLVFAAHLFSFMLLYFLAFHYLIEYPFYLIAKTGFVSTFDLISSFFNISVCSVYFFIAAKKFYNVSKATATVSAVLTGVLFIVLLDVYRMLLFFKIIYSLH